ncbi:hypothetical protein B7992_14135 [Fibrobacter sp. UWH1]|nr:hypothetical protein B7992_14135 [Fibrobacter sp. UWH1]
MEQWNINDKCIVASEKEYLSLKDKLFFVDLLSPICYALYTAPNKNYADSLFRLDKKIKFVYVNSFDM